ncbi:MAG TPA: tetratricopeptide repeat protein, partial [Kiloniellales bacterium]|nr:tetratricopeptide repeat protein [Kiloniellales bacterium]
IESESLTLQHQAQAHYNRANAYHYSGAYEKAVEDYSEAIRNNPQFPGAFYNRGFAHQARGDETAALADFSAARDLGWQRLGVRAPDVPPPRR